MKRTTNIFWGELIGLWFVIVVFWALFRYFIHTSETLEELLFKPLFFVGPVAIFLRTKKSLSLSSLGLRTNNTKSIFLWGAVFGIILAIENIVLWWGRGKDVVWWDVGLIVPVIVSFATAFSEEILYRGFLMEQFWSIWGSPFRANIVSAALFGIGHIGVAILVLGYYGIDLVVYLLTITILGFIQGFIYQNTRSVYASTLAHAFWNISSVFLR